jgi:hypothetical protein
METALKKAVQSPIKVDASQTEYIYRNVVASGVIREPYQSLCSFLKITYSDIAEK